jgi:hypothetical protein
MRAFPLVAGKPAQTKPKTQTVSALLPAVNHNAHEIATDMSAAQPLGVDNRHFSAASLVNLRG